MYSTVKYMHFDLFKNYLSWTFTVNVRVLSQIPLCPFLFTKCLIDFISQLSGKTWLLILDSSWFLPGNLRQKQSLAVIGQNGDSGVGFVWPAGQSCHHSVGFKAGTDGIQVGESSGNGISYKKAKVIV